jgi:hypothetical protein
MLLGLALMKFVANVASANLTLPHDPVFLMPMNVCLWLLGAAELAVALLCLFATRDGYKMLAVLWLAASFCLHQVGFGGSGAHAGYGTYLTSLAEAFGMRPDGTLLLLRTVYTWLLLGSASLLVWMWVEDRRYLKMACPHCGGHIAFPVGGTGRHINCPHCARGIVLLRTAEGLNSVRSRSNHSS